MKQKLTPLQKVLETFCAICVITPVVLLILFWSALPDTIPTHYGAAGVANAWGPKASLIILPVVGVFLYGLITLVSFFPQAWNVPTKARKRNTPMTYRATRTFLLVTKALLLLCFMYITIVSMFGLGLGVWFLPIFIAVFVLTIVVYGMYVSRAGKRPEE